MQLPLAFLDATAVEEVSIELWHRLFDQVGWPSSLDERRDVFVHTDVVSALESDALSDELLQALEALHTLGTEAGSEAIVNAMHDRNVPRDLLPAEAGERELALHLYIVQRGDAALADVFVRAQTDAQERSDQRCYHEFMGVAPRAVTNLVSKRDALRDETLRRCRDADLGDHVQVRGFEDDGVFVFQVIRSDRTRKPLAALPGSSARATIAYRPVHGDLLRYDAVIGRLRIAARAASMVPFYRMTLGRVLFDNEEFFSAKAVCDLRVLQERRREALERHDVVGVGRVRMTECLWDRGDGDLLHLRSSDCFRNIEELRLPLHEGALLQAKLKCTIVGKSTRPVTVTIRAPSRIEVKPRRHEQLMERLLTSIGIRSRRSAGDSPNLWSLSPWRHSLEVWRSVFGRETDGLMERGVLSAVQLNRALSPEAPNSGRVLEAHQICEGEYYGVSAETHVPSRSLTATDLDGLELIPERLRQDLRSRLGISGAAVAWDNQQDLLDLGTIEIGDQRLRLTYAIRPPRTGTGTSLRALAAGAHPVVLVPSTPFGSSELPIALLETPLPSRQEAVRLAVSATGLTDAVPALHSAPDGVRLVVDTIRGTMWVDGIEICGLKPDTQPFRFVEFVARQTPAAVSAQELARAISGARDDGTTAARQAKASAKKSICDALAAAGRDFSEDPFPSGGTGTYRCALASYVR